MFALDKASISKEFDSGKDSIKRKLEQRPILVTLSVREFCDWNLFAFNSFENKVFSLRQ